MPVSSVWRWVPSQTQVLTTSSVLMLVVACRRDRETPPTDGALPTETEDAALWAARDAAWQNVLWAMDDELYEQVPSIAVAVVLDGQTTYAEAVGVREWDTNKPADVDTIYRWASVAKMHTAAAVLLHASDGDLDLHDPIRDLVPEFRLEAGYSANEITLHHLLSHQSGLPDRLDWRCEETLEQWFEVDWRPPALAPPGAFYNYSNSGFNLAGRALERLTGTPFTTLVQEEVLQPSGMVDATYLADDVPPRRATVGTRWRNDEPVLYPLQDYDCPTSRPAAWLHGTVGDLAATAELHLAAGADLLTPEQVQAMADQADTGWRSDGSSRVGYGQFTHQYKGVQIVAHDGRVAGFVSRWAVVPSHGFGVVVVANAEWADVEKVRDVALDSFLGLHQLEQDPVTTTDPSTWEIYAGTYYDPYLWGTVRVEWTGSGLQLELPDWKQSTSLIQSDGHAFWFQWDDGTWYSVRFVFTDGEPQARWFVERGGVAERTSILRGAAERPPPTISPRAMQELRSRARHEGPDGGITGPPQPR
ncbi:MAG: serine hydrolase [Myxococcales bacterium]|nr:serine hydrolase [Myxococcales bacterium]